MEYDEFEKLALELLSRGEMGLPELVGCVVAETKRRAQASPRNFLTRFMHLRPTGQDDLARHECESYLYFLEHQESVNISGRLAPGIFSLTPEGQRVNITPRGRRRLGELRHH